jgi:hypothetical protein
MKRVVRIMVAAAAIVLLQSAVAHAHCDALDGPVVQAARAALAAGDVTGVLRWVQPEREAELKAAFARTLEVRKLGGAAQTLADTWFFETLVRIHRAGEGAPFEGLKPAGQIDPVLAMADTTLDSGTVDALRATITTHVTNGVTERFERARQAKAHANDSVEAGRRYVEAYVEYLHYVEGLHRAAKGQADVHEGGGRP